MAGSISTRKKGAKLGMHYQKSDSWGGGGGNTEDNVIEKIVFTINVSQEHFFDLLIYSLGLSRPFTTEVLEAHISRSLKP